MTHGSLSIEKRTVAWNRPGLDAYLICAAIGVIAGVVVTFVRTPIGLPGHKALLWMIPVLAARLRSGATAGASTGALFTAATTLCLGGRVAGGGLMLPALLVAGVILDMTVRYCSAKGMNRANQIILLAMAGMAANMVCFANWFFLRPGTNLNRAMVFDLVATAASYAFFGLLSGLLGAIAGFLRQQHCGDKNV